VPALKVGDQVVTENPATLFYLASVHPEAALLPGLDAPLGRAEALSDLAWCASTLHPLVRQAVMPQGFTSGNPAGVREAALKALAPLITQVEARLSGERWWYGATWSIVDVYLAWLVGLAKMGGVPGAAAPALDAHTARVRARPSFVRALAREQAAVERHAIPLPPGARLAACRRRMPPPKPNPTTMSTPNALLAESPGAMAANGSAALGARSLTAAVYERVRRDIITYRSACVSPGGASEASTSTSTATCTASSRSGARNTKPNAPSS